MAEERLTFQLYLKQLKNKGDLVYEYNPFRNLRAEIPIYQYNNKYLKANELFEELNLSRYQILEISSDKDIAFKENKIVIGDIEILTIKDLYENNDIVKISKRDIKTEWGEFETLLKYTQDWGNNQVLVVTGKDENKKAIVLPVINNEEELNDSLKILYEQKLADSANLPELIEAGTLMDFQTDQLNFSLNHPVNIIPQASYDGSVNLILNDGYNIPRLINNRFSPQGFSTYEIVDRQGENDTNIYNIGSRFDINTSLYKNTDKLPKIQFLGTSYGGQLPVGNYHFYFKLEDADGNQTDFIGESRLVSIFKGFKPKEIEFGFRQENSYKKLQFFISDIDYAYQYVRVYYTVASADVNENSTVSAYMIEDKFPISANLNCYIDISGSETSTQISVDEINRRYSVYSSVGTQAVAKNMLFLGNVQEEIQYHTELKNLSLFFLPYADISKSCEINKLGKEYNYGTYVKNTYYNSEFIYNYTGYWNNELYRFGIVYVYNNNTLSPVFNVRGIDNLSKNNDYSNLQVLDESGDVNEVVYDEDTFFLTGRNSAVNKENIKGVIRFNVGEYNFEDIIGIKFRTNSEVIDKLKELNIKGFFFVRQKRIPTLLCQAFIIHNDCKYTGIPLLPTSGGNLYESLVDTSNLLTNDFGKRLRSSASSYGRAALCPEYDVNSPYYNTLFSGNSYVVKYSEFQPTSDTLLQDVRHFYVDELNYQQSNNLSETQIVGVEDNVKLVSINNYKFSARAGEAESEIDYAFVGTSDKPKNAMTTVVRGSFGPYLGLGEEFFPGHWVDIMIPDYNKSYMMDYFKIRYRDNASYYSISERTLLSKLEGSYESESIYGGDCFICQFTHRVNRNFSSPSAPTNDVIVDEKCYVEGYKFSTGQETYDKDKKDSYTLVNLGDLNAIKLGMWVTMKLRSSINLNIRSQDDSHVDESALYGHSRTFYPKTEMLVDGPYKIPEALCYNKAQDRLLSQRLNVIIPDVPAYYNYYTTRIAYSNINITNSFANNFRVFEAGNYIDYSNQYGAITKLINLNDDLICICEHAVLKLNINEKILIQSQNSSLVNINTQKVLPEVPTVINDTFGTQWPESIIKTPVGIYGIDTQAKKIWRTNGSNFEIISDFKVQEFLNNNISLLERETTPIIGVRNVKSHYNNFKHDVLFTFYDNTYGFEEKVWNLCWNEVLNKWVTFYSWVPSYSENIQNQYFSFDRNTSKWVAKLGTSHHQNSFADGITLSENIISKTDWKAELYLDNRTIPSGDNVTVTYVYSLERDNYGNYKLFNLVNDSSKDENGNDIITSDTKWYLILADGVTYEQLLSHLYEVDEKGKFKKDEQGRKIPLDNPINADKIVRLINIRVEVKLSYDGNSTLSEAYVTGQANKIKTSLGFYESVIAVIPESNMQFLTTDFWKHGQAGIINIADEIKPTHWYGKQHPFEFEFVVADNPQLHKIFDNLQIISNKAAPESFHYEIVGECYDFAKDKKNMYIRQEATKELYQFNGSDIVYNPDYKTLNSDPRQMNGLITTKYDKSTIFPLYYNRQDTINEIEDYYHLYGHKESYGKSDKNFSALAGAEIVRYPNLGEYRIWNHAKAVDIHDFENGGRMRGNMQYKEDKWDVQINPINLVQKNEDQNDWTNVYGDGQKKMVPAECNLFNPPAEVYNKNESKGTVTLPSDWERNVVSWGISDKINKEVKLKDKFIKIRVRYSGKDLAVISALKTLYSISYA